MSVITSLARLFSGQALIIRETIAERRHVCLTQTIFSMLWKKVSDG